MTTHAFDTLGLDACPFMPVFGPPQVMFVKGARHRAVGRRRQALPRLPRRPGRDRRSATPTRSSPRRSPSRPASCCTSATCSPTPSPPGRRWRSTACWPRSPASSARCSSRNSGAEANECAIKLARKHGGRGRHAVVSAFGSFHGRTLATLAATGQPAKHEPFQPMPEGFRHVAWGDIDALDRAVDASRRRRADRAGAGRGRRQRRRRPATCRRSARSATHRRRC